MWFATRTLAVQPQRRRNDPDRGHYSRSVATRFPAGRFTLWVLDVGLACCAVEVVAASLLASAEPVGDHPADVLVVAGTLTDTMAPAIVRLYAESRSVDARDSAAWTSPWPRLSLPPSSDRRSIASEE